MATFKTGWIKKGADKLYAWSHAKACRYGLDGDGKVVTVADKLDALNDNLATKSPIVSPVFTGVPKAPTASLSTKNTQIATTEFAYNKAAAAATESKDYAEAKAAEAFNASKSYSNTKFVESLNEINKVTTVPLNFSGVTNTNCTCDVNGKQGIITGVFKAAAAIGTGTLVLASLSNYKPKRSTYFTYYLDGVGASWGYIATNGELNFSIPSPIAANTNFRINIPYTVA